MEEILQSPNADLLVNEVGAPISRVPKLLR